MCIYTSDSRSIWYTRVWNLSNTQETEMDGPYRAAGVAKEVCSRLDVYNKINRSYTHRQRTTPPTYVYIYIGKSLCIVY